MSGMIFLCINPGRARLPADRDSDRSGSDTSSPEADLRACPGEREGRDRSGVFREGYMSVKKFKRSALNFVPSVNGIFIVTLRSLENFFNGGLV